VRENWPPSSYAEVTGNGISLTLSAQRAPSIGTTFSRRGLMVSDVDLINEVNQHRARLVFRWVTVYGRVNHTI